MFNFIHTEIKDFQHSKKKASFRVVFTKEPVGYESSNKEVGTEDSEEIFLVLEEKKKEFSLREIRGSYEKEIDPVIDRISGSVVLFFRLGSHTHGTGIYMNIVYDWLGRWKYIRFDTPGFHGIFKKKLS
jgi:hypothetical protein